MKTRKDQKPHWQQLLIKAVKEPGAISEAYSRFWNYSSGNQMLALVQCTARQLEPGPIATYHKWRELGRQVRKGEKAISLVMPLAVRSKSTKEQCRQSDDNDDKATRTIFVLKKRWFVLAQTEGEPFEPEPIPDWDKDRALLALGIREEPFQDLDGNVQGYARDEVISVSPLAALPHKTRFHEFAHIVLGHTQEESLSDTQYIPESIIEAEAEAVALLCCESLGLSGADFSRGYIQYYLRGKEIPERSARRIFTAADKILKAGLASDES